MALAAMESEAEAAAEEFRTEVGNSISDLRAIGDRALGAGLVASAGLALASARWLALELNHHLLLMGRPAPHAPAATEKPAAAARKGRPPGSKTKRAPAAAATENVAIPGTAAAAAPTANGGTTP